MDEKLDFGRCEMLKKSSSSLGAGFQSGFFSGGN